MTAETLDVFRELGIDPDEIKWQDLALCHEMETNLFYDAYEADEAVAQMVDEVCLSCPVRRECLESGLDNKEYGVWGGIFLNSGKVDKNRNSHKSEETWQSIRDDLSGE